MNSEEKYQYLRISINILKFYCLWPLKGQKYELRWRRPRTYWIFFSTAFTWIPLGAEIYYTFHEDDMEAIIQIQVLLANICIWGMFYMAICFIENQTRIKEIVNRISTFEQYVGCNTIEVDKKITFFSKCFVGYAISGMLLYCIGPWMDLSYCEEHRSASMDTWGVPCLIIVRYRMPFRFDVTPYQQFCFLHQTYVGCSTAILVVTLTMLICGILIHVVSQLKNLRRYISELCNKPADQLDEAVHFIIKYHIFIIEYFDDVNKAFGTVMILHMTLTSFVISVLCFEIVMMGAVHRFIPSIRFGLHLLGWLVILFLVCYYGQKMIDESVGVATDIYATPWYNWPLHTQKDVLFILGRSQKPLTLKAMNLGRMSAETFLAILRGAYSYFTLLIQFI